MVRDEHGGVDMQDLIRQIAATGADPSWVAECIAIEQGAIAEARERAVAAAACRRVRPQLKVVGGRNAP